MPQAWKDALAKAVAAGQIPEVPLTNAGNYPKGVDASDPKVCNSAAECKVDGDIWAAPDGMLGLNFDDVSSFVFACCPLGARGGNKRHKLELRMLIGGFSFLRFFSSSIPFYAPVLDIRTGDTHLQNKPVRILTELLPCLCRSREFSSHLGTHTHKKKSPGSNGRLTASLRLPQEQHPEGHPLLHRRQHPRPASTRPHRVPRRQRSRGAHLHAQVVDELDERGVHGGVGLDLSDHFRLDRWKDSEVLEAPIWRFVSVFLFFTWGTRGENAGG